MTKSYDYKTHGTCSTMIHVEIENDIIKDVKFTGGCNGNTKGVSKLCLNRNVDEVIELLRGTKCGLRNTSCPDQLSIALEQAKNA